jgi:hypothetical protein
MDRPSQMVAAITRASKIWFAFISDPLNEKIPASLYRETNRGMPRFLVNCLLQTKYLVDCVPKLQ